jgi:hypothetical protein
MIEARDADRAAIEMGDHISRASAKLVDYRRRKEVRAARGRVDSE